MTIRKRIVIISSILALVSLNCILASAFPKLKKSVPTSTPPVPTEIVIPEITIQPTVIVTDNSITVTFTETDVQNWILEYVKSNPDMAITDPVVVLDNGLCKVTGTFQSGFIKGAVEMTFSVALDDNANPVVTIQTLQLGGMDLPDSIKESFNTAINQSITSSLASGLEGKTIESIIIDDGLMTIITTN